jgi:hypothetical protein
MELSMSVMEKSQYYGRDLEAMSFAINYHLWIIDSFKEYFDLIGVLPWYVLLVLMKKEVTSLNTALYDRMVIPFMQKIESCIPAPLGKNLILITKKN